MCGRFTIKTSLQKIIEAMSPVLAKLDPTLFLPRFNVAPSQSPPIVRLDSSGQRVLEFARWGFVPAWTKGKPKLAPINAKCETAVTSGMYRSAFAKRRCLVPADGFYEWKGAKPPKQPFYIHRKDDGVFAFAGLWERWKPDEEAEPVDTFTILTTSPNELMANIHNRMPVIIDRSDYGAWLEKGDAKLLKPAPTEAMEAYPVSTKVNKPSHDQADCVERIVASC